MFSFLKKNGPVKPDFKFSEFSESDIGALKTKLSTELNLFEELRNDFQHLLLADDINLFVKGGPIEEVDLQMKKTLLPDMKNQYLNVIGSIRFIRLHDKQFTKDEEKVAIEIFEKVVQGDSDVISDTIHTIENVPLSTPLETSSQIQSVGLSGRRVAMKIPDGVFTGSDDLELGKIQIRNVQDLNHAITRVSAFFHILKEIASLDESLKQ